jgi:hypothetical protein
MRQARQSRHTETRHNDPLVEWIERRTAVCRLTPEHALRTLDEAEAFARDRGMLTLMPDCALPSLFGACHEEPYQEGGRGFGAWPKTKWSWNFALRERPGIHVLKIHNGKGLYVTGVVLATVDPLCREALAGADAGAFGAEAERLVRHLAGAGPALLDDLKEQLMLSAASLRNLRARLERVGAVVSRDVMLREGGERQTSELARWDQVFPQPQAEGSSGLPDLIVAGMRAAVVAPEAEARHWFSWTVPAETIDALVAVGRLLRPAPGWLAWDHTIAQSIGK